MAMCCGKLVTTIIVNNRELHKCSLCGCVFTRFNYVTHSDMGGYYDSYDYHTDLCYNHTKLHYEKMATGIQAQIIKLTEQLDKLTRDRAIAERDPNHSCRITHKR